MKRHAITGTLLFVSAVAGITIAQCTPPCGTPGWNYGAASCGPGNTTTQNRCDTCCLEAGAAGTIDGFGVLDCQAFRALVTPRHQVV